MSIYSLRYINEVYFGDDKISKMQENLSKFRARCFKERGFTKKENTYKELFNFNRSVEEVFGFKTFSLQIEMMDFENAFTLPISNKLDIIKIEDHIKYSKNHVMYDKDAGYSCIVCITYKLLMNRDYTDREIMAIILHEIGHNFSVAINKTGTIFSNIGKAALVYNIIISAIQAVLINPIYAQQAILIASVSTNVTQKFIIDVQQYIAKNIPYVTIFSDTIDRFAQVILATISKVLTLVNIFNPLVYIKRLIAVLMMYNPITLFINHFEYNDEKTSDTFSTMYGYGTDLSSALTKLEFGKDDFSSVPFISQLLDLTRIPIMILATPIDCHPMTITRINEQIKYLKKELNKSNMDEKMKKEIQEQIKQMEHLINDKILEPARNKDMKDPKIIGKLYTLFMYDICGGDIRELVNHTDNHEYIDTKFSEKINSVVIK